MPPSPPQNQYIFATVIFFATAHDGPVYANHFPLNLGGETSKMVT